MSLPEDINLEVNQSLDAGLYDFTIVDEQLIAKHSRLSDFDLNPIKEDLFSGDAWYFGQVAFIRDENNIINGCKVSAGRVRNLYFKKVN